MKPIKKAIKRTAKPAVTVKPDDQVAIEENGKNIKKKQWYPRHYSATSFLFNSRNTAPQQLLSRRPRQIALVGSRKKRIARDLARKAKNSADTLKETETAFWASENPTGWGFLGTVWEAATFAEEDRLNAEHAQNDADDWARSTEKQRARIWLRELEGEEQSLAERLDRAETHLRHGFSKTYWKKEVRSLTKQLTKISAALQEHKFANAKLLKGLKFR